MVNAGVMNTATTAGLIPRKKRRPPSHHPHLDGFGKLCYTAFKRMTCLCVVIFTTIHLFEYVLKGRIEHNDDLYILWQRCHRKEILSRVRDTRAAKKYSDGKYTISFTNLSTL